MKREIWIIIPMVSLMFLFLMPSTNASADNTVQTIFADPYRIDGTGKVGQTIIVNINITNAQSLYSWQAGLKFDPAVLECKGVHEGEFLKRAGVTTLWMAGSIDNTAGKVGYSSASLTGSLAGVNGTGQLMYVEFEVKSEGISDIHLVNVKTNTNQNGIITITKSRVLDRYTVIVDSSDYVVSIIHNSTRYSTRPPSGIPVLTLNTTEKAIAFNLTGRNSKVLCNVTIPKSLLGLVNPEDTWTVKIDGSTVSFDIVEDEENTYISFLTEFGTSTSTKVVEISGTWVVPEIPQLLTMLVMLTLLIASAVFQMHKRKISAR